MRNVSLDHSDCVLGHAVGPGGSSSPSSEVCFWDWYISEKTKNGAWDKVFRLKDPTIRHAYAQKMIDACNNNNVRYWPDYEYRSTQRREVYNWIKNNNLAEISTLNTVKYCDCSSLATALLLYFGIDVGTPTTYSIVNEDALEKTGKFFVYETTDFTMCAKNLLLGDILVYNNPNREAGHAAVVVHSTYDMTSNDYVDKPVFERDINEGRFSEPNVYASNGPTRPNPSQVPVNLCDLSDFELFLLGAYITGGGAATFKAFKSAKSVDEQPIA